MNFKFIKGILVLISFLLVLNLIVGGTFTSLVPTSNAHVIKEGADLKKLHEKKIYSGRALSIACSDDGSIVFFIADDGIYRSMNYGNPGSWELVSK
jgi:hypothetical protein